MYALSFDCPHSALLYNLIAKQNKLMQHTALELTKTKYLLFLFYEHCQLIALHNSMVIFTTEYFGKSPTLMDIEECELSTIIKRFCCESRLRETMNNKRKDFHASA